MNDVQGDRESGAPAELKLVVGVGASAGGLEVLEELLKAMPVNAGLAIIVVQHLSPDYRSHMVPLLAKHTTMPVCAAEDGMPLAPNSVFLIPPKKVLTVSQGALRLAERGAGLVLPIDILFKSIAEEYRERSAGVVLSGTGSDGVRGVRTVKEVGGLVLVQDPETAKFDGMPRAAASNGMADFVLPVRELPARLVSYAQRSDLLSMREHEVPHGGGTLDSIFGVLRRQTGIDFSGYKPTTVLRRIERRLAITQSPSLENYLLTLQRSPQETAALFREFLIGVTRFFRDPDVFEQVRRDVIPSLVDKTRPGDSIRVWVPGCSTGEEAYSLAMLFEEHFEAGGRPRDVKIFATDIDANALETAGAGVYHESIAADVSPERLTRFFVHRGDSYQIARFVRQRVVFANHDLTRDPPFSRVSMISCRNLLIYFSAPLQARVLSSFRFALKPGGILLLGSSETAGDFPDLALLTFSFGRVDEPGSAHVEIVVRDTGYGMDAITLQRATEPLFTTKSRMGGSGLGLTLASRTATALGGSLSLQSELGRGTAVTIRLPLAAEVGKASGSRLKVALPELKVLLVDDDPATRGAVQRQLVHGRAAVHGFADGPSALAAVQNGLNVDIAVVDVNMPVWSGPELVEHLLALRPDLPVLFITGASGNLIPEWMLRRPQASLLHKPWPRDTLLNVIATLTSATASQLAADDSGARTPY